MSESREVRVHLKETGRAGGKNWVVVGTRTRWLPIFTTAMGVTAIGIAGDEPEYVEKITDAGERRPMAADLFLGLSEKTETQVRKLVVTGVRGQAFIGELHLSRNGDDFALDCRPTDGLAITLTAGAPIYAADALLDRASMSPEQFARWVENLEQT
jgi:bifunctional DNase/RNase